MSLSSEVVLPFGDGKHKFALKGKQIEDLEKICNASISEIADRVMSLRPRFIDVRTILLLGLEGGGMPSVQAHEFIGRFLEGRPLAATGDPHNPIATAAKVMEAVWFGIEDLKLGEAQAGESPATPQQE